MRKQRLWIMGICAAAALTAGGCGAQTTATTQVETTAETTQTAETTAVVEPVTGAIESMENQEAQVGSSLRVYGPAVLSEDGKQLQLDNQSDVSSTGEMILNIVEGETLVLDGQTGIPAQLSQLQEGAVVYAYIGEAMTMSLPPITNAKMILCNVPEDAKAPDYAQVSSMVMDAGTNDFVLNTEDGAQYRIPGDCDFFPYLTRNAVRVDDLTPGRRCLIWSDQENNAERIMIFAN